MVSSAQQEPQFNLHQVLDSALQHGVLARRDHMALTTAMFCDTSLSTAERHRINRVFDFIRMGRVKLED
jgi:hypothetical protein